MTRKCLYSGEIFTVTRYNQKFSSRKAQIAFNNEIARTKRHEKAPIDRVLDKNRTILMKLLGDSPEITKSKEYLLGAGVVFRYFSSSIVYKNKPCQMIYNVILIYNDGDKTYTIKKLN